MGYKKGQVFSRYEILGRFMQIINTKVVWKIELLTNNRILKYNAVLL